MKDFLTRLMLVMAVLAGMSSITACERDEGPAEDIGEEIDEMAE
ncbi:MAG: hypothetical protein R3352_10480 [Salinisphaeraceae bacterium]|nr:hypothetical protein [Salinisphaeraceae bacterium]